MEMVDNDDKPKRLKKKRKKANSEASGGRQLALSVHSGLMEGAFFTLSKKHNVIGRKINAHIPIKDSKVSREHATISQQVDGYYIRDLGSTNGTFVNNERVEEPVRLCVGDKIRIGAYTFKVEPVVQRKDAEVQKWSSETKVLFRSPSLKMQIPQKLSVQTRHEKSLWLMIESLQKLKSHPVINGFNHEKLKWIVLAIGVLIVLAATMTGKPLTT